MKIKKIEKINPRVNYRYKELYDSLSSINKDNALQVTAGEDEKLNTIYNSLTAYLHQHNIRDKYKVMLRKDFLIVQLK